MEYKHTVVGQWLFNYCKKGSFVLGKHKGLYGLLQCTGGIIGTILGSILLIPYCFCRYRGNFYGHPYMLFGNNWGGMSMGYMFYVADNMGSDYTFETAQHECGHNYQNALLGPLFFFLVAIPSGIRYGYQRLTPNKKHADYDAVWFEDSATKIGELLYPKTLDETKK